MSHVELKKKHSATLEESITVKVLPEIKEKARTLSAHKYDVAGQLRKVIDEAVNDLYKQFEKSAV